MSEGFRSFEMSLSRQDFLRLLPGAVGGAPFEETGDLLVHSEEERSWRIALNPLPVLHLGTLKLERHGIEWRFSGYTDAEINALVLRFERHFHRGGG